MADSELFTLLPFLKGLVEDQVPDVREVLRRIMNSNWDEEDIDWEGESDEEVETISEDNDSTPTPTKIKQ